MSEEEGSDLETERPSYNVVMSKNQMKKLAKQKRWEETKHLRREKERMKNKLKKQKRKEAREQAENEGSITQPRKKIKMSDPDASQVSIVIDCSFDGLMNEPDVSKLTKQIQRCYSANRHSPCPFQFYLTSFGGATKESFKRRVCGYPNWDAHIKESPLQDVFPKECIMYLTSDSPNVLDDLDSGKAYVIGGLVDHNHHKGYCLEHAEKNGWSHAQLPIGDYVKLNSRKVLTINQVFEILSAFLLKKSWKEAFYHVLPQRKVREYIKPSGPCQEDGQSGDGNQTVGSQTTVTVNPSTENSDVFLRAESALEDRTPTSADNLARKIQTDSDMMPRKRIASTDIDRRSKNEIDCSVGNNVGACDQNFDLSTLQNVGSNLPPVQKTTGNTRNEPDATDGSNGIIDIDAEKSVLEER